MNEPNCCHEFIPYKIAERLKEAITFTLKVACRAKDLDPRIDDETREALEHHADDMDYESFPYFRQYKTNALRKILKQAIDRKYRISLAKGVQMLLEALIILILMISLVMKANVVSIFFLIFIFKFSISVKKTDILVRFNTYQSIIFMI